MNRVELMLKKIDISNIKEFMKSKEFSILKDESSSIEPLLKLIDRLKIKLTLIDSLSNLKSILITEKIVDKSIKSVNFKEFFKNINRELQKDGVEIDVEEISQLLKDDKIDTKILKNILEKNINRFNFASLSNTLANLNSKYIDLKPLIESKLEILNRENEISNKSFMLFANHKVDIKSFNSILNFFNSKIVEGGELIPNSHLLLSDSLELEDVKFLHNFSIDTKSVLYSFSTFLHNLKSLLTFDRLKPKFDENLINKIEIMKNLIVPDSVLFELIAKSDITGDKNIQKIIFSLFVDRFKDKIEETPNGLKLNHLENQAILKDTIIKLNSFNIKNIYLDEQFAIDFAQTLQKNLTDILNESSLSNFKTNLVEQLLGSTNRGDFTLLSNILLAFGAEVYTFVDFSQNIYNYFQFKKDTPKEQRDNNMKSKIDFFAQFRAIGSISGVIYREDDSTSLIIKADNESTLAFLKENINELKGFKMVSFENAKISPLFDIQAQNFFDTMG